MSASPGQDTFRIDLAEATDALPTELELFGSSTANFPAAGIANAPAGLFEWP